MEATVTQDRTLLLDDFPFGAGQIVEVIVLASDENPAAPLVRNGKMGVGSPRDAWSHASDKALQEVWDNPEDAAYDDL